MLVGPGVKSGLNIRMDDPTELGGDLVAAAVGALDRYPLPCLVVDMGAATAIGVLDAGGSYIGGLICPGVALSGESLAHGASQLSEVSLEPPRRLIGKNTRESTARRPCWTALSTESKPSWARRPASSSPARMPPPSSPAAAAARICAWTRT